LAFHISRLQNRGPPGNGLAPLRTFAPNPALKPARELC
jgi:hypothetical protein